MSHIFRLSAWNPFERLELGQKKPPIPLGCLWHTSSGRKKGFSEQKYRPRFFLCAPPKKRFTLPSGGLHNWIWASFHFARSDWYKICWLACGSAPRGILHCPICQHHLHPSSCRDFAGRVRQGKTHLPRHNTKLQHPDPLGWCCCRGRVPFLCGVVSLPGTDLV